MLRISEARDLGEFDRFKFYDHTKNFIAAPPDVLEVDEKNLREHYIVNVVGVIITTNHKSNGIYLPADDRRHYVAWSNFNKAMFTRSTGTRSGNGTRTAGSRSSPLSDELRFGGGRVQSKGPATGASKSSGLCRC